MNVATSTASPTPAPSSTPTTRRRSGRAVSGSASAAKYVTLVLACVITVLPLLALVFAAFKTGAEYRRTGPLALPKNWANLDNFVTAFDRGHMLQGFVNTTIILAVSLTGTILIGSMAAYAIDRFDFRGRRLIMGAFLFASLVPAVTTQVATFQVVDALGLFNTRGAAIALFMGTDIIAIYIFLQFIRAISISIDEAAILDGASRWRIYWTIILPLLRPAIAMVAIIKGIAVYNEFYIPFLYMPARDLGVISTSLFRFKGPFGAHWEIISAGTLLVIIPSLIVFLLLQRHIYNGLTAGAVK